MDKVKKKLKEHIDKEALNYFHTLEEYPKSTYENLLIRWGDDSVFSEKQRFDLLESMIPEVKQMKILDMAAGCGSFVLQGLRHGWNTYGVEPEAWKQDLIDLKFEENQYPREWRERIVKGIGESLPFPDESFDAFDSWQTIEHVQDEKDCIFELYRVLKKGGQGILRGPDYISFYEGHYRMFWFPMMGKGPFARMYLKLRGRPNEGLDTFHPVNPFRIKKYARQAGFEIVDIKKKQIYAAAKRKYNFLNGPLGSIGLPLIYAAWDFTKGIKGIGRAEATISLLLIKK
jgi:SAM-dependent methyltransferase